MVKQAGAEENGFSFQRQRRRQNIAILKQNNEE